MSDPYEDHELREEWNEFKYYTDGVTTARMSRVKVEGEVAPCVKVFMASSATDEDVDSVYEKADEMELVRYNDRFEEEDEHVFVRDGAVEF